MDNQMQKLKLFGNEPFGDRMKSYENKLTFSVLPQFTTEELEKLPPLHQARKNPDLEVVRSDYKEVEFEPLNKIEYKQRKDVLFGNQ